HAGREDAVRERLAPRRDPRVRRARRRHLRADAALPQARRQRARHRRRHEGRPGGQRLLHRTRRRARHRAGRKASRPAAGSGPLHQHGVRRRRLALALHHDLPRALPLTRRRARRRGLVAMAWRFERVAGPFEGPAAGLAWDGASMLFSILSRGPRAGEGRILRFDPKGGETSVYRPFTNRTSGIAFGRDGALYGCQELSRRIVRFNPDGSASLLATLVDERLHNLPTSLAIDSRGRIWFCDSKSPLRTSGPLIYPQGDLQSVLLLERIRNTWTLRRLAADLDAQRAIALSPDERTLYVADRQGLHAFAVQGDALDARRRISESALSGLNVRHDDCIVGCAGASLLVLEASGNVRESWPFLGGEAVNSAFGGPDLYVTTA